MCQYWQQERCLCLRKVCLRLCACEMLLFRYFSVSPDPPCCRTEVEGKGGTNKLTACKSVCLCLCLYAWGGGGCFCVCACYSEVCVCSRYVKPHSFESVMWITFSFPVLLSLSILSSPFSTSSSWPFSLISPPSSLLLCSGEEQGQRQTFPSALRHPLHVRGPWVPEEKAHW